MIVLPMGTIMAGCMLVGVLFAAKLPLLSRLPRTIQNLVGTILLLGGMWNTFWHGLRHLTDFWGIAALVSGVLMMIAGMYLIDESKLPGWLVRFRPIVLVVLLFYGLMYAITIARL